MFGIGHVEQPEETTAGRSPQLQVILIRRKDEPFKGCLALPGGFVNVRDDRDQGESLETAAHRELEEETGVTVDYLEQLYTFGDPGRDPRGRVISVAYYALVRTKDHTPRAGSDAKEADWYSVDALLASSDKLAFDHDKILAVAVDRLRAKIRYAPIGFNLLPQKFTIQQLRKLYEAILGHDLDEANFRKKLNTMDGLLVDCGLAEDVPGRPGRTPRLYRFDKRAYDRAVKQGFDFEV